jgi:hypothetical protein
MIADKLSETAGLLLGIAYALAQHDVAKGDGQDEPGEGYFYRLLEDRLEDEADQLERQSARLRRLVGGGPPDPAA